MKYILPIFVVALIIGAVSFFVISNSQKNQNTSNMEHSSEMKIEKNTDGSPVREVLGILITQNESGESGVATLREKDGKITVDIKMEGSPAGVTQPAHIHLGTCQNIGTVKHPLSSVVNGISTTTLNTTFDELKKDLPVAINVHKSTTEPGVYVSCGNLFSE